VKPETRNLKPEIMDRLNLCDIRVMSKGQHFCVFVRDGCLAMVPWDEETFSGIGSTGLSLDQGLGYLVYRDGQHYLAGNDFEIPAEPPHVEKVLRFSADLKAALGLADS
jgi:hypothetical protein